MFHSKFVGSRAGGIMPSRSHCSVLKAGTFKAQHFLYFLPLPHEHGSLRAGAMERRGAGAL